MAGQPKRRAKALAAAQQIPEALLGEVNAPAPASPPAYARPEPPKPIRFLSNSGVTVGPQSRAQADHTTASEMARLAQSLRAGVQVRIERIKPTWCAGWIEDLTLDSGSLAELYEHLREEWGGRSYRCTVLLANGLPAFETRIEIAGRPREEGRLIERETDKPAPAPIVQAPAPSQDMAGLLGVFQLVMSTNQKATEAQMAAMRELSERSAAQNQGLIEAMLQSRTAEQRGGSLAGQLSELMEANRTIEKVRKTFGAANPGESAPAEKEDLLQGALKEATKGFFSSVIASEMAGKMAPRSAPRGAQMAPRPRLAPNPIQPSPRPAPSFRPGPQEVPEAV